MKLFTLLFLPAALLAATADNTQERFVEEHDLIVKDQRGTR